MFLNKEYYKPLFIFLALLGISLQGWAQSIDDYIKWKKNLKLQETEKVVNVLPFVNLDSEGNFLVSDFKENQVRVYDKMGNLKNYYGQSGRGPGDFRHPMSTVRLPSGDLLTGEMNGKLSLYDQDGDSLKSTFLIANLELADLHALGKNKVLIVGFRRDRPNTKLLRIYDIKKRKITKSFFKIPVTLGSYGHLLYSFMDLSIADTYKDKILATFSFENIFYLFNSRGKLINKFKVKFDHFRKFEFSNDTAIKRDILKTFSRIENIEWLSQNRYLVQYVDIKDILKHKFVRSWALVTTDGKVLFEFSNAPSLLVVNQKTKDIYYRNLETELPNKWKIGKVR